MKRVERFQRGDVVPLDCVYDILGIIPVDCYEQDDIADAKPTNDNDCGETIRFIKDVTIKIEVITKEATPCQK